MIFKNVWQTLNLSWVARFSFTVSQQDSTACTTIKLSAAKSICNDRLKDERLYLFCHFLSVSRFYFNMKLWSHVWLSLTDALDSLWYGLGPALLSLARASVHQRCFVRSFSPSQSKAKKSNLCLGLPSEWWCPALLESGEICQMRGRMSSGQVDSCCPTMDQLFRHYEGRVTLRTANQYTASQTYKQILFIYWGESFSSASFFFFFLNNLPGPFILLKYGFLHFLKENMSPVCQCTH